MHKIYIIGFAILLALVAMPAVAGNYLHGDINFDGEVNCLDITALERIIAGLPIQLERYTPEPNQEHHIFNDFHAAQTFTASARYELTTVKLPIYCQESNGDLIIIIRETTDGIPKGRELGRSILLGADIPTGYPPPYSAIKFEEGIILEKGCQYAIVAEGGGVNIIDSIHWCNRIDDGNYAGGKEWRIWNGEYLESPNDDLLFEIWGKIK